ARGRGADPLAMDPPVLDPRARGGGGLRRAGDPGVPLTAPREAVLAVLREAGEPLHWTVIQDRALRGGTLDPFEHRDIRGAVLSALRALVDDGLAVKTAKGVYAAA